MPRKDRSETVYDGSVHHVVQRGINKSSIFKKNEDYACFKEIVKRYLAGREVNIYNYCLMPNHIHMLIYVRQSPQLSKFMQAVSLAYGAYYRKVYKYTGYFWKGRFKNFNIEKDSYLLECARYIERNPLRTRHKMVEDVGLYRWSSYNFYVSGTNDDIVTTNPLYKDFGKEIAERQNRYKEYILTPRPYEEVLDDVFRL